MNNLEFIEKEIETVEKELVEIVDITNDYLELPDTYENKNDLIDGANERYSNYSLRLSKLIQIKNILEAWYIIKNALELTENELGEEEIEMKVFFTNAKVEVCDTKEEFYIIKKALEIENEIN